MAEQSRESAGRMWSEGKGLEAGSGQLVVRETQLLRHPPTRTPRPTHCVFVDDASNVS
jgi:hypothetical protein